MAHLVFKNEALLLEEPLESLCGASAIYLTIENNILSSFEQAEKIINEYQVHRDQRENLSRGIPKQAQDAINGFSIFFPSNLHFKMELVMRKYRCVIRIKSIA
ncbi:hypothetical protein Glove_444g15 [Diversispora epigaea]|uniref:Uncharacterized protein n=1 Tax=Diversispora epigaea TaxID=1348612 RepID=A0A397GYR1_9GLOM|nr:hypothetical protein Glove_444g15 [Diversispora epigaea]